SESETTDEREAAAEGAARSDQEMTATRPDPHERCIRGTIPLWEHERPDGAAVALWNGDGSDYLVYRFGAWSVMLPCEPTVTGQALTTWADQLDGVQSPDGLLDLEATAPIHVNPWHDANGPTVRLSNQGVIVDIQPGSYICKPG